MPNSTPYRIRVHPEAARQILALPGHVRQRVRGFVASLSTEPRPAESLELREMPGRYRVRIDRWRVVYSVADEAELVTILRVGLKEGPEFYVDLPE